MRNPIIYILMLVCPLIARADDGWILTTADFSSQRVSLISLSDDSLTVSGQNININQLLTLERTDKPVPIASKFVAILSDGDRAAGLPLSIQGDFLIWSNPALGELHLPLKSVTAMIRSGDQIQPGSGTEDVVTLSNNDTVHGIITQASSKSISVQQTGGDATDVPLDSIVRVTFASTVGTTAKLSHGFRITLADGTAITAAKMRLANDKISATLVDGSSCSLPLVMVTAIEQANGPVVWVSSPTPLQNLQTPFLDVSWPTRFDRAVDGEPIR